jgi:hypothetical protein
VILFRQPRKTLQGFFVADEKADVPYGLGDETTRASDGVFPHPD